MERFLDVVLASLALIFLSPLFIVVSLILSRTGEREVFYLQERIGLGEKKFKVIKFATMLKDSPNIGTVFITIEEDPRVLPVGHFLRKTKINELPQLLNILVGDMSVIGPRPLTDQTFSKYPSDLQVLVRSVKPGLSGIGSIMFRDEESMLRDAFASAEYYDRVITPYKGELEKWFVSNKGLYVYIMAILVTIWVVMFPKSSLPWCAFRGLPKPPDSLQEHLNFKEM